jgi:hypothetical protein
MKWMTTRELFKSRVFKAGTWFGLFIGVGVTHAIDRGNIVLSIAILAWSSMALIIGDRHVNDMGER